jgi:diacylglycerol kinase (ATP)
MRKNRDKGFSRLKVLTDQGKKTISVICGGDGTVMWVVSELIKHKIQFKDSPLAVIPLGTGNDFSRCLGWGK